jgi:hypothetical protein
MAAQISKKENGVYYVFFLEVTELALFRRFTTARG